MGGEVKRDYCLSPFRAPSHMENIIGRVVVKKGVGGGRAHFRALKSDKLLTISEKE